MSLNSINWMAIWSYCQNLLNLSPISTSQWWAHRKCLESWGSTWTVFLLHANMSWCQLSSGTIQPGLPIGARADTSHPWLATAYKQITHFHPWLAFMENCVKREVGSSWSLVEFMFFPKQLLQLNFYYFKTLIFLRLNKISEFQIWASVVQRPSIILEKYICWAKFDLPTIAYCPHMHPWEPAWHESDLTIKQ